jgi:hypothetical protein
MTTQSAADWKMRTHISPPVRESAVDHAMDPPAWTNIQIARHSIVTRMMGPANASYLRIISMPKLTMMTCMTHNTTKESQPRVERPRNELSSSGASEGARARTSTRSTTEAR